MAKRLYMMMRFGVVGRTGPEMRQLGFRMGPREGVILGANLGRAIVTNGNFAERHGPVPKLLWADVFSYLGYKCCMTITSSVIVRANGSYSLKLTCSVLTLSAAQFLCNC